MQSSHNPAGVLAIMHVEGSVPRKFVLTRLPDGKSLSPVAIPSPYEHAVEGQPNSNLMRELRWYLEGFLDYPFHPETVHADHVLDALRAWGSQVFNALFDRRDAGEWLSKSDLLQIRSDTSYVLSWPWEALFDPQAGSFLAHRQGIERRLNKLADPPALGNLPNDRVNILMVVARPYKGDVRYRSIARPLIDLIHSKHLPAHVDVLRPPTFDQFREHLRSHPNYYHVVHFDGHGAFGDGGGHYSPHQYQGPQGCLVFENDQGEEDPKSASDLSALLHEHAVPAVVLNACQSAALDEKAGDPFATVATALLQSGMRSVVAMAYSLYVSAAQVFLPAFYGRLFESRSVAEAALAGRQQMLASKKRISARGPFPLEDWLLPVLYQQAPLDLDFARQTKVETFQSSLPEDVQKNRDEYGFIGRDGPILDMERALQRKAPCILIQGLGGVGKTTLARGFLRWLDQTGGLDGALWFDFREIRSAEYVLNRTGGSFYGENFSIAPNKLELLALALKNVRVLMVWDNFESTAQNLPAEHRAELGRFLDAIHGTKGKVIITSRSTEEWLSPPQRFLVPLGGLDGEEQWEYCEAVLRELGLKVNRDDPELKRLMDQLAGHPLAMRVVLPKLERMSAAEVSKALRNNIVELGLEEKEEQGRLFATLRFVEQGLQQELRPLMGLVGLHEAYLDADYLEAMAKQVDPDWTRKRVDQLMSTLVVAGLAREAGSAVYEMHPLMTSYLGSRGAASEPCQRAFVDVMGSVADALAPRELHEQRTPFLLHGASFHLALQLAEHLRMDQHFAALTQSLAAYAQNTRDLIEAFRLFQQLAQRFAAIGDSKGEAAACHHLGGIAQAQGNSATAREWFLRSLNISERLGLDDSVACTYHSLGSIADEQREFATAREWYLKSITISERLGIDHVAASTYHQLGSIADEEREFATALEWYLKSLAIKERLGNESGAAHTYHQLGVIAQKQGEFAKAREWYLKSLAIKERQGDERGAASTYHTLGMIAHEQKAFATAREWYLKSLAVEERQGNERGAANTYHELGRIAQEQKEYATARQWYLKSLAISEQHRNEHAAATTFGQLGLLAALEHDMEESGTWLMRSIIAFAGVSDLHGIKTCIDNFAATYLQASAEDKEKLRTIWNEADLFPFPVDPGEAP